MNTLNNDNSPSSNPWYREPWAWFVLSPLIVVVISCSITVTIAVKNADDRVVDNYYKEGRMINTRMDEDIQAAHLAIAADMQFDHEVKELVVRLQTLEKVFPDSLTLEMSHISEQAQDHNIQLKHIAKGQYQAELEQPLQYRWYIRLRPTVVQESTEDLWRLRGSINFSEQSTIRLSSNY